MTLLSQLAGVSKAWELDDEQRERLLEVASPASWHSLVRADQGR